MDMTADSATRTQTCLPTVQVFCDMDLVNPKRTKLDNLLFLKRSHWASRKRSHGERFDSTAK